MFLGLAPLLVAWRVVRVTKVVFVISVFIGIIIVIIGIIIGIIIVMVVLLTKGSPGPS